MSVFFICWSTVVHWFFSMITFTYFFSFHFSNLPFLSFLLWMFQLVLGHPLIPLSVAFSIRPAEFSYCCEHFFVAYPGMFLRTIPSRNLLGFLWLNKAASSLQLWKQRQCALIDLIRTQIPAKADLLFPHDVWVINIAIWVSRLPGEKRNYSITNKLPQQHICNCHFPFLIS